MRPSTRPVTIGRVPDKPPIRLTVELERVEPLCGRLGPVGGPLVEFSGWIGLAAALDRAIRADGRFSEGGEEHLR
jgi:hypothetical protein